jgi:hypothetical protein
MRRIESRSLHYTLGGDPRDRRNTLRGIIPNSLSKLLKPISPLSDKFPIVQALFDYDMKPGKGQGSVTPRTHLKPKIGPFRLFRTKRINDDELRSGLLTF